MNEYQAKHSDQITRGLNAIEQELLRAKTLFPEIFHNQHEAIAVIREEYLELEKECFLNQKKYDLTAQRKEAVQLAAMCLRFIVELTPVVTP